MSDLTLTGCNHTENENTYEEIVCGHCEDEHDNYVDKLEARIKELKAQLEKVRGIVDEMGEDTALGSEAIGSGVRTVGLYLERMQAILENDDG